MPAPPAALTRLRFICQLADTSNELPMSALSSLVAESVDVVVQCARNGDHVQVTEVVAVEDLQTGPDSTAFTLTELFRRERLDAPLTWSTNLPVRAARPLAAAGFDVRQLLGGDAGTMASSAPTAAPPPPSVPSPSAPPPHQMGPIPS